MVSLDTSLVDAVGKKSADKLRDKLGLESVGDLLGHYPRRYYRIGDARRESGLQEGDHLSFVAEVINAEWHPNRNSGYQKGRRPKGRVSAKLALEEGTIEAVFWNQPWMTKALPKGAIGLFSGVVGRFRGAWQLNSPTVERFHRSADDVAADGAQAGLSYLNVDEWIGRIMPIYPSTSGLDSSAIRRSVEMVLGLLEPVADTLPDGIRGELGYVDLDTALRGIHQPPDDDAIDAARERLAFEEALGTQLSLAVERADEDAQPAGSYPRRGDGALAALDAQLPFELTASQRDVGDVLAAELAADHPMHRLLQGDVGSGKTIVALRAMLQVADGGGQSALLAPTEVLAHQHARSITAMLGSLGRVDPTGGGLRLGEDADAVLVTVLTSGLPAKERKQALLDIASGASGIVIGTHALLEPTVSFADLGLVVIDEQHRFGVEQRDKLRRKGREQLSPHTLVMTATPIPRTLAITAFGALETLALTDMPPGRTPVKTNAVPTTSHPRWLVRVWERIIEEVEAGHQAYVVCPRIDAEQVDDTDDSGDDEEYGEYDEPARDDRPIASVEQTVEELRTGPLSHLRVEALHGRMSVEQKDDIMRRFGAGEIDVLVSTTVIEVGVDVPNATVMAICDADRFGLATLHQLRGRVGRGSAPGVCLLLTTLSESSRPFERLRTLEQTGDGFEIAEVDLRLRKSGDILGTVQHGARTRLRLLSLDDVATIEQARDVADQIVGDDPKLERHPVLRAEVDRLRRVQGADFLHKS
ncbi:ATP-dependent DNA helicase RecG [Epidermidibacterium keratini]